MKKTSLYITLFFITFLVVVFCFSEVKAGDGMVNGQWVAPIGIPTPSFGITETYRMYDEVVNRNSALTYSESASGGYYTHYVNRSGTCSDTSNDGTVGNPRCTIPASMPAGSILEIHNTYNFAPVGYDEIVSQGTISKPVFVRGINSSIKRKIILKGTYLIVENLICEDEDGDLSGGNTGGLSVSISAANPIETHHIALRNNDIGGNLSSGGVSIASYHDSYDLSDILLYNNIIHDGGDMNTIEDTADVHGIIFGSYCHNVWAVDNEVYNQSGSGIVAGAITGSGDPTILTHVYVGRNHVHNVRQAGVASKNAQDIIFSQNIVHDIIDTPWSTSKCFGFQYGPERVWFLYNECYNSENGLISGSNSGGPGVYSYVIGNIFYNIYKETVQYDEPNYPYTGTPDLIEGTAIGHRGGVKRYIINNTIYNVDAGISILSGNDPEVRNIILNNIISNISGEPSGYSHHLRIDDRSAEKYGITYSDIDNNIIHPNGGTVKIVTGMNYSNTIDLTTFRNIWNKCVNCSDANPLYTNPDLNNFTLQTNSTARDAGIVSDVYQTFFDLYGIDIAKDVAGISRPQGVAWDIGAYEYMENNSFRADVDNSSQITTTDALLTLRNSLGLSMNGTAWRASATTGDVNCDGVSNSTDALLILRYSLGLSMSETGWCGDING